MARSSTVVCPHCGASLESTHRGAAEQKTRCPHCRKRVHLARLGLVLLGALLYLLGGGALAYYCFERSFRRSASEAAPLAREELPDDGHPGPSPPPPARGPTVSVDPLEQRKIDDAIVKGAWYLKEHQESSGSWGSGPLTVGYAALPGLTLLECGLPGSDPILQKAAALVRRQAPKQAENNDTYQRALAILFLDRLGEPSDEELIQYLALCVIAGQRGDDGGWGYYCPSLTRKALPKLLKQLRGSRRLEPAQALEQWRKTALNGKPFGPEEWLRSDNSITQFAILALWAAQRHDVPIEKPMALVERRFRSTQLPSGPDTQHGKNLNMDGSWPYRRIDGPRGYENPSPWPTMTCAGLLGLAVAHGLAQNEAAPKDQPLADPCIRRALAMLGREIDRPDEKRGMDLYFLWSLERVGVLYNLPRIEHKDWYTWGRKHLLARQQAQGHWQDGGYWGSTPVIDTCFALLFLEQANLARDLTSKLQLLAEKK